MNHNDTVRRSFKKQAEKFAAYHMSKAEYTDYLIRKIAATGEEHALEVAAGTCICGRALAPYVKDITCLDMTEEMLAQGIRLAGESHIKNIYFQSGNAEKLPYEPETFDLVITRLSFHHFDNPEKPFEEMKRVLKKGESWWSGIWKLSRSLYGKLMIRLKICVILPIPESSAGKNLKKCSRKISHCNAKKLLWCR